MERETWKTGQGCERFELAQAVVYRFPAVGCDGLMKRLYQTKKK